MEFWNGGIDWSSEMDWNGDQLDGFIAFSRPYIDHLHFLIKTNPAY